MITIAKAITDQDISKQIFLVCESSSASFLLGTSLIFVWGSSPPRRSRNLMDNVSCCTVLPTNVWTAEVTHMNQVLLTFQSLLKWPEYGFVGLIVLVWRSVEAAYWNIPLEDDFSDLDPRHSVGLPQLLWLTSMHQKFPLTKSEPPPVLPCLSFWNSLFPPIRILQSCELSHHFPVIPMNNSAVDETFSPWCHVEHQFQSRMLSAAVHVDRTSKDFLLFSPPSC